MKNYNEQAKKLVNNETPFKVIRTPDHRIDLYWTTSKGAYGFQVVAVIYDFGNTPQMLKTSGCGYCKESFITADVFKELGYCPKGMKESLKRGCVDRIDFKYHVGGNFFKVPKKDIRKV